ncbi:hypothetical protein [Roseibium aggregatum]|uniref:hypothetical protein n=1 Tax=Roseibium aggregatum TaxID=187304 RepID=UPI0012F4E4E2|nr:hypothetical protein [Roseibium aggregatum]
MNLYLNQTPARSRFKQLLGQANHLIITILVGLDAVENKLITECPEHLRTTWAPKDAATSAARSRIMTLEMALVRATDSLDAYIIWSRREPALIQCETPKKSIDTSGRSVAKRFNSLDKYYSQPNICLTALINIMIFWRNELVHSTSEERLDTVHLNTLEENLQWYKNTFQGMDTSRLVNDFRKENPPTLKEITSIIRAVHKYIEVLDELQLNQLNPEPYLREVIKNHVNITSKNKMKIIQSIWGRNEEERSRRLKSMLTNYGFSSDRKYGYSSEFSENLILKYSSFTPKALISELDLNI